MVESQDGNKQIKIRNFQALIDDNYNHNSNNNGLFFSKASSFYQSVSGLTSTSASSNAETTSDNSVNEDFQKQVQLNLRISTVGDTTNTNGQPISKHVSKIMIQNYSALSSDLAHEVEESLKLSLSNLRLEGYVQPLFRVEKISEARGI